MNSLHSCHPQQGPVQLLGHYFKGEVDKLERIRNDLTQRNKHLKKLITQERQKLGTTFTGRVLEHQRLHQKNLRKKKQDVVKNEEKAKYRAELAECAQKNAELHKKQALVVKNISEKLKKQASIEHSTRVAQERKLKKEMGILEEKAQQLAHELEEKDKFTQKIILDRSEKEQLIQDLKHSLMLIIVETPECKVRADILNKSEFSLDDIKDCIASLNNEINLRKRNITATLKIQQTLNENVDSLKTELRLNRRKLEDAKITYSNLKRTEPKEKCCSNE